MRGIILLATLPLLFDLCFAWGMAELRGAPAAAEMKLPRSQIDLADWDHLAFVGHGRRTGTLQAALLAHADRTAQAE